MRDLGEKYSVRNFYVETSLKKTENDDKFKIYSRDME